MAMSDIPASAFPDANTRWSSWLNEPVMSLSEAGFLVEPMYHLWNIPNALPDCYARMGVVQRLKKAEALLPDGMRFKIYDAYRPVEVQQALWDKYYAGVKQANPELDEAALEELTRQFVSKPSYDEENPSPHNTGGAVDLTIVTKSGHALNMGSCFDDFSNRTNTGYFENQEVHPEVRDNRRLLYGVMIQSGFTNLPSEWWHYDYGDAFWSFYTKKPAMYKGMRLSV